MPTPTPRPLLPLVHPEDRDTVAKALQPLQRSSSSDGGGDAPRRQTRARLRSVAQQLASHSQGANEQPPPASAAEYRPMELSMRRGTQGIVCFARTALPWR